MRNSLLLVTNDQGHGYDRCSTGHDIISSLYAHESYILVNYETLLLQVSRR